MVGFNEIFSKFVVEFFEYFVFLFPVHFLHFHFGNAIVSVVAGVAGPSGLSPFPFVLARFRFVLLASQ